MALLAMDKERVGYTIHHSAEDVCHGQVCSLVKVLRGTLAPQHWLEVVSGGTFLRTRRELVALGRIAESALAMASAARAQSRQETWWGRDHLNGKNAVVLFPIARILQSVEWSFGDVDVDED